ncbi:PpiC-type peptidyl-prolyl cis-trans isomerase [Rivularia sp. IAM M-261]|nr:PpiC-type peptidyl-prolyl cis-trans isomerase [Rivularia sp. IAM M-261]
MSEFATISNDELLYQIKLSCQVPTFVEEIITRKIITHAAQEAGIEVETHELQQAADNLRLINNLSSADMTWLWLEKHHLSLDEFEQLVYHNVLTSKLTEHLFANQVEQFFVEHQFDYAQVVMYEIVLDDKDLAMELFYAVNEEDISFPEIAHQYIQDTEQRRYGGYQGIQSRKDLKPEVSAAVFGATPPQIIKPVITSEGVHLIFVEEIITPQLDETLYSQILFELFDNWLKQRIEEFEYR